MKILSWNCNGKFREKYKEILKYNADIYVIQECEKPDKYFNKKYENFKNFANNYLWIGNNDNKGLAVFAKDNINLKELKWKNYSLRYFLPILVNNKYTLLAVWAGKPYIEEYYVYQQINIDNYDDNTILIGDFNSNVRWDRKHNIRTHTNASNELKKKNLISVYHKVFNEIESKETKPTFYLHRNINKPYHIDYAFCHKDLIKDFKVLDDYTHWLNYSDHLPIILEII